MLLPLNPGTAWLNWGMLALLLAFAPSDLRYIDNGHVRLGVDVAKGGAIVYLSREGGPNMINDADLGRQIQLSFYSGPVPFKPNGKQPAPAWTGLGWNPIQTGDCFGHPSKTLSFHADKTSLRLSCVPMQWPLNNEPGECTFDVWIRLVGSTVQVSNTLHNRRSDHTQFPARTQELPAVYTNAPWYRLVSYTGDAPFSGDDVTELTNPPPASTFPWVSFHATEGWTALLDKDGNGLGVVEPQAQTMSGGFFGKPGEGGSSDGPTGYIAPNLVEILDWNIDYRFDYALVLGSLADIRQYAAKHAAFTKPPLYNFDRDRQHWSYVNAEDAGWPVHDGLKVKLEANDPQLVGPKSVWRMIDGQTLTLEAAFRTQSPDAQFFWSTVTVPGFSEENSIRFKAITDGKIHTYRIDLSQEPGYKGMITGLRFDPEPSGARGDWVRVKSIRLGR